MNSGNKTSSYPKMGLFAHLGQMGDILNPIQNSSSTHPTMKTIFPERNIPYNLRRANLFQCRNSKSVFNGTECLAFRGPNIWAK